MLVEVIGIQYCNWEKEAYTGNLAGARVESGGFCLRIAMVQVETVRSTVSYGVEGGLTCMYTCSVPVRVSLYSGCAVCTSASEGYCSYLCT